MRNGLLLSAALFLAGCQSAPPTASQDLRVQPSAEAVIGSGPDAACSALSGMGLAGSRWREGAYGFGCASEQLPIGPRNATNAATSSVWYEVRGADPNAVTTIVLGGDVRVPEADEAIRAKLAELSGHLLQKLKIPSDQELTTAIAQNGSVSRRLGDYIVSYTSEVQANVRENRLTIKRAI